MSLWFAVVLVGWKAVEWRAERGHKVTLIDKADELGGQIGFCFKGAAARPNRGIYTLVSDGSRAFRCGCAFRYGGCEAMIKNSTLMCAFVGQPVVVRSCDQNSRNGVAAEVWWLSTLGYSQRVSETRKERFGAYDTICEVLWYVGSDYWLQRLV